MAKKSFSWEDLAALNLETGKIDEDKKKRNAEERDRRIALEEEQSIRNHNSNNTSEDRRRGYNNGGFRLNDKYVGAPYNFVPLWEKVIKLDPEKDRISHASAEQELISGEINYKLTAKTPIIISEGKKDKGIPEQFIKNPSGQYAIPGSSIRGLIRNNAQILSLSSLADDIDDYTLMYREVGGAKETSMNKDIYDTTLGSDKNISVLKKVKAGYIELTDKGYRIYHTKPDNISEELDEMNYYVLSEKYVFEQLDNGNKNFEYLKKIQLQHEYNNHEFKKYVDETNHTHYVCIGKDLDSQAKFNALINALEEYKNAKSSNNRDREKATKAALRAAKRNVRDNINKLFKACSWPISYEIKNNRVTAIGKENDYSKEGYMLISGAMQEKKVLYVIPEKNNGEFFDLDKESKTIKDFQIDYASKEKQLKEPKDFWNLPKNTGDIKPIFYIKTDERLYMGFTPHLRLFYSNTIHDGLGSDHKKGLFDYSKALFGYSNDNDSYKSRLSFSDAVAVDNPSPMEEQVITPGGPKPSSYADYLSLRDDGKPHTYNDDDFQIRGVKQYWLRDKEYNQNNEDYKENVVCKFQPLPKGTGFTGKVRFHNLRKEELGLLIWSLRLNEKSDMNIGKGKPYGYGRIKLNILEIKKFNTEKAYNTESLILYPMDEITREADILVDSYKKEAAKRLNLRETSKIDELPSIKGLMDMKDSRRVPNPEKIRYMSLDNKEYQNRKALNSIKEVLSEK